jgi:hypothetical protein
LRVTLRVGGVRFVITKPFFNPTAMPLILLCASVISNKTRNATLLRRATQGRHKAGENPERDQQEKKPLPQRSHGPRWLLGVAAARKHSVNAQRARSKRLCLTNNTRLRAANTCKPPTLHNVTQTVISQPPQRFGQASVVQSSTAQNKAPSGCCSPPLAPQGTNFCSSTRPLTLPLALVVVRPRNFASAKQRPGNGFGGSEFDWIGRLRQFLHVLAMSLFHDRETYVGNSVRRIGCCVVLCPLLSTALRSKALDSRSAEGARQNASQQLMCCGPRMLDATAHNHQQRHSACSDRAAGIRPLSLRAVTGRIAIGALRCLLASLIVV